MIINIDENGKIEAKFVEELLMRFATKLLAAGHLEAWKAVCLLAALFRECEVAD